jgi:hypothetical protein
MGSWILGRTRMIDLEFMGLSSVLTGFPTVAVCGEFG